MGTTLPCVRCERRPATWRRLLLTFIGAAALVAMCSVDSRAEREPVESLPVWVVFACPATGCEPMPTDAPPLFKAECESFKEWLGKLVPVRLRCVPDLDAVITERGL